MRWAAWLIATCALARAEQFDYVIVGGGTCGLAVAGRLTELQNVSVAVIEAGGDERKNPNVTNADLFVAAFDTPVDYAYESVNQTGADNRQLEYHSGKALGGSSAINGMTYIRGQKAQIDAWETVGNHGWNWDTLLPYYEKAEHYHPPTPAQVAAGVTYEPQFHGTAGPVQVSNIFALQNGTLHTSVQQGWEALGEPQNPDANSGSVRGFFVWPYTADRDRNLRYDSATAYYWPVASRPNLKVFRGLANKIVWANGSDATASGVEYTDESGKTLTLQARKEVIVSAGALRTPPFLEMSGIGNAEVLSAHSIQTKVSLPGVGENLIDQPQGQLAYTGSTNYTGMPPYATFATAADYFGSNVSAMSASVNASIPKWAATVAASSNNYTTASSIEFLLKVQHDLIFNQSVPSAEILTTASGTILLSVWWPLLPFSRGSVHIGSALDKPRIDPAFFSFDYDLETTVAIGRFVRPFWSTDSMKNLTTSNIVPGSSVLPENATDAEWRNFIRSTCNTNTHPLGTAAMLPQHLGGVVDTDLKVYGTSNVRVIDASIIPMQISGHLTSTLYAIAERASDIIKASM